MSIIHKTISINTNYDIELIDITEDIQSILRSHEIHNGIINISTKHTTSAIVINENENGLKKDYINFLREIVPKKEYYHDLIDNNARSHLMALFTTANQTLPIIDSMINLGTWQSIFFVELDGPRRNRVINITIMGE